MTRSDLLHQLSTTNKWDVIIIGGGATGLGIAMDAATRHYKTLLVEQADFAKGTSSKATKLVHGGVRYMAQGNLALVREACYERGLLLKNAPHLTKNESFVIPCYSWFQCIKYTLGLKFYDLLAGKLSLGNSGYISRRQAISSLLTVQQNGLKGAVLYHDGQFDDARLALNIAQTAIGNGACVLNYMQVKTLLKNDKQQVNGIQFKDTETGILHEAFGKVIINATGVYVDAILKMDEPASAPLVRPSQGVHITVDHSFLPGEHALMIPETSDGRVLFAVPWHNKLIIGTTDTPVITTTLEPMALESEINFILETAGKYLTKKPLRSDVLSVFAGLRPLAALNNTGEKTKEMSRSHKIILSASGLLTITGGKWTTFRRMAQDVLKKAINAELLPPARCVTEKLPIHGYTTNFDEKNPLHYYGSDLIKIEKFTAENPELSGILLPGFPYTRAMVVWAIRYEYARKIEDILGRRIRLLFLNAQAAISVAPLIADMLAAELHRTDSWKMQELADFTKLAKGYLPDN